MEIVVDFPRDSLLKGSLMAQRESALVTVTPRSLSGLAVIFLLLAALFALLNGQKVKTLRANAATAQPSAHGQAPVKPNAPTRGSSKTADVEDRATKAEPAPPQPEQKKAHLQPKLNPTHQ